MVKFQSAKNGRYILTDGLKRKLPKIVILTLAPDQTSLRIYSKARWQSILNRVQQQYVAKIAITETTKSMVATAHETEVGSNFLVIPETLLLKAGLDTKEIYVEFAHEGGAVLPSDSTSQYGELPVELSFSSKYHVQNEDGLVVVDFEGVEPEVWIEKQGERHRLLPRTKINDFQKSFALNDPKDLENLAAKYDQILHRALRLLEGFEEGKLFLLDFFFRFGTSAIELAEDCPALAYVAANYSRCGFKTFISEECDHLPARKRAEILRIVGYSDQSWVSRLFKKIPAAECRNTFFHDLKEILLSDDTSKHKILMHLPAVNSISVRILMDDEFLRWFDRSFFNLAHTVNNRDATSNFWQLYNLKETLAEAFAQGFRTRRIKSIDDLVVVHDQLVLWMENQEYLEANNDQPFPPPPFPTYLIDGNKEFGIFPLTTFRELWEEGKMMHHCIAGYARSICQSLYAYHIELPGEEPATFTIWKNKGQWEISEIQGVNNSEVSSTVLAFVTQWLDRQTGTSNRSDEMASSEEDIY